VKAHARAGRVDLQVEDGGLDRFLILVARFGQTVDKGVSDAEFLATSYSWPCEELRRGDNIVQALFREAVSCCREIASLAMTSG